MVKFFPRHMSPEKTDYNLFFGLRAEKSEGCSPLNSPGWELGGNRKDTSGWACLFCYYSANFSTALAKPASLQEAVT